MCFEAGYSRLVVVDDVAWFKNVKRPGTFP